MTGHTAPFYCPYCGEEDLRPSQEGHGSWQCAACTRAFRLAFTGLLTGGRQPGTGGEYGEQGGGSPA